MDAAEDLVMASAKKTSPDERTAGFRAGAEAAADLASMYNGGSSHPFLLEDCILSKLNLTDRRPRKNPHAERQWLRGYACALASVSRLHDKTVEAVVRDDDITWEQLEAAGIKELDLGTLRKAYETKTTNKWRRRK